MSAITKDAFLKRLEKLQGEIAKKRDELDDLITQGKNVCECCERAEDSLDDARAALSELL